MITFHEWLIVEKFGVKHDFSCAMADFQKSDADKIIQWSKKHIPDNVLHTEDGMGREDEIHVTALYGLHTSEIEPVKKIIDKFSAFELTLGKISKFDSHPDYDVIKIEIAGSKIHALNKSLRTMEHTNKFKEFIPHCTIAYVKKGKCDNLLKNKYFEDNKVLINSITFSPAKGKKTKIKLAS